MIQIILLAAESLLPPAPVFVINQVENMSNTWDTVFEEGFSSVRVCNRARANSHDR
jgi:hypothetical protein